MTFTLNGVTVNATVAANGTVTTNSPLTTGTWAYQLDQVFSGAPNAVVKGNLVVPAPVVVVTCTAPAMRNTTSNTCSAKPAYASTCNSVVGGGVWVADQGVLVTGANTLPAACVTVGDACWQQEVANGNIKFVNSGVILPLYHSAMQIDNLAHPVIFAFYKTDAGWYNTMPIYADRDATSVLANQKAANGGWLPYTTDVKGYSLGIKHSETGQCGSRTWSGAGFSGATIPCPI